MRIPFSVSLWLTDFVKSNTAIDVRAYIDIVKTLLRRRFALDFLRAGWYPIIENV